MARLGDLDDYKVAEGEPDVRGWHVLTREAAAAGKVADLIVDLLAMRVSYLDIELDKGALRLRRTRHVLVPIGAAWLNEHEKIVRVGVTAAELIAAPAYDPRSFSEGDHDALRRRYAGHLTRSEQELAFRTQRRMAGKVEVRKRVETEHVEKSAPVAREEVTERRPARGGTSKPRVGEDEIVVPVMEEQVVAEKRTVPKEVVVIKKRAVADEKTVAADLKKERIDVERR